MIYTIGHSNHELPALFELLRRHGITAVADVRSAPYSRRLPQYNREPFRDWLQRQGIEYVFLGKELGGRRDDPGLVDADGRIDYERVAKTPEFAAGVERLRRGMTAYRIALLCAERDPLDCHRGLLIAPHLQAAGIDVIHILADATLEPHRETEARLLRLCGLEDDLFGEPEEQRLAMAYRQRAAGAAYRSPGGRGQ